uniref:CCD97-like C-terminal domain-containing protein n=1 Tax=Lotharella oceanica TaxID=641309 RepID=A0A7S2TV77_9EUKA|mmetsp:Transcript_31094/g.57972  ORF Transcript_31094/g.57972 Transcript_31094/m.57972 type:complete len:291 (+) Transcript_31094:507-1379(+)
MWFLLNYGDLLTGSGLNHLKDTLNVAVASGAEPWCMDMARIQQWIAIKEQHLRSHRVVVRNRRYEKMKQLENQGYFLEEQMKRRAPELYNEIIGRFRPPASSKLPQPFTTPHHGKKQGGDVKEKVVVSDTASTTTTAAARGSGRLIDSSVLVDGFVNGPKRRLSHLLSDRCSRGRTNEYSSNEGTGAVDAKSRDLKQQEAEQESGSEAMRNAMDSTDMDIGTWYAGGWDVKEASFEDRRSVLVSIMKQRFVQGRESEVDYTKIDDDASLDNYEEMARDAQERWFDDQPWD